MNESVSVIHLTSVHSRFDIRVFLKECSSLARNGHRVSLIVADGRGEEQKDGVSIYDVGVAGGRIERIRKIANRIYDKALFLDGDIYHFHDPELIRIGLKLKKTGKKVIFDAHEDVPKQIWSKPYLNSFQKWILSKSFALYEKWTCPKLDGIVTATPNIRDKFQRMNIKSVDINNYPLLGELASREVNWDEKKNYICYVGGISRSRGILEIVRALSLVKEDVRLQLAGKFDEPSEEKEVIKHQGWNRVDEHGFIPRLQVRDILAQSVAGLVTFLPGPNHIDAQPNKMFEYMSAGVPVIASHFSLWREIIEGYQCGLCVDPLNPQSIAEAIDYLISHPEQAREMGENGQRAVKQHYNWSNEEKKLLEFYGSVIT